MIDLKFLRVRAVEMWSFMFIDREFACVFVWEEDSREGTTIIFRVVLPFSLNLNLLMSSLEWK